MDRDMPDDELRYDHMVEEALRSVVGRALSFAAEHGLPGEHHFYITFRTDDPETDIPARLRERYASEMTIVLQYQFWDLTVGEEDFAVTLSFGNVRERLKIPYRAVVAFADPSVRFGLQFDVGEGETATEDEEGAEAPAAEQAPEPAANGAPGAPEAPSARSGGSVPESPGRPENVVSFETFRKKST